MIENFVLLLTKKSLVFLRYTPKFHRAVNDFVCLLTYSALACLIEGRLPSFSCFSHVYRPVTSVMMNVPLLSVNIEGSFACIFSFLTFME